MVYRSAFEGFRRYKEEPIASWRESNDVVARIGGWKAYARESQGVDVVPKADTTNVAPTSGDAAKPAPNARPEQRK